MTVFAIVGFNIEAPMTPARHAEFVHGVGDDAGRVADRERRLTTPSGGRGASSACGCDRRRCGRSSACRRSCGHSVIDLVAQCGAQSSWIFAFLITVDNRAVSSCMKSRELFRPDVRRLRRPARRAWRAHRGSRSMSDDGGLQFGDDGVRRLAGASSAEPGAGHIRRPRFLERRHIRQQARRRCRPRWRAA